jgi:heme-degrading monooxygenase HmoA
VYLTLRRYAEIGARMYEVAFRKVEAGLVPMLKARPGFRSYCALLNEEGEGVSVTAFDDRESAARANEEVFGWVEANLRDLLPDPPEVIAGACGLAEAAPERGGGHGQRPPQPPYVVVREFADLGPPEGMREAARRLALPLIAGSPGFRSVCLFRDEREPSRAAMVALFDTRADALRAHERSMRALREAVATAGGVAWPPPRVGVGRAIVFATAD